jgi:hypothetical protein
MSVVITKDRHHIGVDTLALPHRNADCQDPDLPGA